MTDKTSVISGLSARSKGHSASKAEAAAIVAELRVKMKYIELESKKKLELAKLKAQKDLEIAEARLCALDSEEQIQRTILYGKEGIGDKKIDIGLPRPQSVEDYVQDYINKHPLVSTDKTGQPNDTSPETVKIEQPNLFSRETDNHKGQQYLLTSTPGPYYSTKLDGFTPEFVPHNKFKEKSNLGDYSTDFANLTKSFAEQVNIGRLPTPEPGVFSGDPLTYPCWKGAFETLIERRGIPSAERIYYLKRYLSGAAKESVEGFLLLNTDQAFDEAKAVLDKRFGNPFIVANAFRDKLESWPKIDGRDGPALRKLADYLGQCLIAMQTIDSLNVWNDERENRKILVKLPEWLTYRWGRIVMQCREEKCSFPPFKEFVNFVNKEADIMCDPVTSFRLSKPVVPKPFHKSVPETNKPERRRSAFTTGASVPKEVCAFCDKGHNIGICELFLAKTLIERKNIVRERNLCFSCLKSGHRSKNCPKKNKCKTCSGYHPTALHGDVIPRKDIPIPGERNTPNNQNNSDTTTPKSSVTHMNDLTINGQIDKCSMIVPVWLSHCNNPSHERLVYALLDTQSDTTFVLQSTCDALNVDGPEVKLMLSTMTSEDQLVNSHKITGLMVRGFEKEVQIKLPVTYTREIMPANRNHIPTPQKVTMWPHLEHLASELIPLSEVEVGLLIGYNCPRALTPREIIPPMNDNEPYGQRTDLGWGVIGIIDHSQIDSNSVMGLSHTVITYTVPQELQVPSESTNYTQVCISLKTAVKEVMSPCDVSKLLELDFHEHKTNDVPTSHDDRKFLDQVEKGIKQRDDKHYEMPLPFKEKEPNLPDNRSVAIQRLMNLKGRLVRDEQYKRDYCSFMQNLIQCGHAEKVPVYDVKPSWYIPHHGVYHRMKRDKIRVVFDCSSQYQGVALNDHLLKGPDLTNTLIGVLCRFRKEPVAIQCDIEQMFYQFKVSEYHRDYLRFLWWESDFDDSPTDYRMTVHLFGATSSPGCANFGLKRVADDNEYKYGADAANFVRNNFYVDDGLTSVATVDEAMDLIMRCTEMCKEGGLRLHKFVSNSKEVLAAIPSEDCAKEIRGIDLLCDTLPIERALGVNWCIESDCFQFRIMLNDKPLVRRSVLSTINSIYDPLGFIAPVLLIGKQILQETCKNQLDWDSPLPEELQMKWEKWRSQLFLLETLQIPRCYKPLTFGKVKSLELHHFADASTSGYGQSSYLRFIDEQDIVHCSFVMGKARVSPLKAVTIPRLELNAAVVSVRISEFLHRELQYETITEVFWSDSKVVLAYISNESRRFHTFVANRVQQIRDWTEPMQWRYVKSAENPADVASRGVSIADLSKSAWLTGPDFLWQKDLPSNHQLVTLCQEDPEIKHVKTLTSTTKEPSMTFELQRLEHISNWHRAKKAIAACLKLKSKLVKRLSDQDDVRVAKKDNVSVFENIKVSDLQRAELEILKLVQREAFEREVETLKSASKENTIHAAPELSKKERKQLLKVSPLSKLDPYTDKDGLLRVGGRICRGSLPLDLMHPVILPGKHHVTQLVIRHFHKQTSHQGRGMTVNEIRANGFWIVGCGAAVSRMIAKCVKCRKYRSFVQSQKMADLPSDRMEEAPPFSYCGVDIFGPFYIKEGRKELKRYGALFTCLVSRAIHIETTNSLSSDAFINALRRFIAIRGPIRQLRSDQGTNFIGAQHELQEINNASVRNFLQKSNCDYFPFVMNTPSASHMGGVWERQIRTARSVLSSLMDHHSGQLDDEGLRTLMSEVMAIVNCRPLSVDTLNDPTSLEPLTPNHLLTLKTKLILPPLPNSQRADMYSKKMWRRVQHLSNEFWHRWKREFLQTLQQRQKWLHPKRDVHVGDVVLVKDENLPRNLWQVARVCETYTDDDGHVRKAKVAVGDRSLTDSGKRVNPVTYLQRPIHKLVLLLESENTDN